MIRRTFNQRWQRGDRLLDSPVLGRGVRIVGEDEFREQGVISSTSPAGDNLIFLGRREKIDLEVLEVILQNQSPNTINSQLHASGAALSSQQNIPSGTIWCHAGFILMPGQVLYLRTQLSGQWSFELRWALYYGRKK